MAQHDYSIANQGFPATRADINNVLSAIATNNSGTSAPSTQYAGQFWLDTTSSNWVLYIHDGADDIQFATIDTSANTVNFTDSALDVVTDTTPQLGGDLDLNSNDITGTGDINITGDVTATNLSGTLPVSNLSGLTNFKNIIINGDMSIAQRGTSATGLGNGDTGYYTCDRWKFIESGAPTFEFTQTQETDVPTGQGFATSLKMDCTTAQGSLAASDALYITQIIESQNLQYIKKGTANAESLTCSFWVKSNKTGTYIVGLQEFQNTRYIANSYTINSANTWEKKTITFAGDTTGTLTNDNSASLYLQFYLSAGTDFTSGTLATAWESTVNANRAVGQVNLADSTSNEWFITGVQLEAGTTASDFEFLPYDMNLLRCQRYYNFIVGGSSNLEVAIGGYYNSTQIFGNIYFPYMRVAPSADFVSGTNYYKILRNNANDNFDSLTISTSFNTRIGVFNNTEVSGTAGTAGFIRTANSASYIAVDAEL